MKKVMTVMGTRPETIKLMPVLASFEKTESCLVLTSQHQELVKELLPLFGLEADHDLGLMRAGQSPAEFLSRALPALDEILVQEAPDLVLVQGDTTTALAAALAAFHRKIPVAHLEAGLRTGVQTDPFPEEMNRRLIAPISALHFAPTWRAVENLVREGVERAKIVMTGNTIVDTLDRVRALGLKPPQAPLRAVVESDRRIVLLTCHRRESFGRPMRSVFRAVARLVRTFPDLEVVFPVHPNPQVARAAEGILDGMKGIHCVGPLDYFRFLWVLERSDLVITDSGGVQEEAPAFGVPVVVARETTERMEGVDAGIAVLAGRKSRNIFRHGVAYLSDPTCMDRLARVHNPYGDGKAAGRVVRAIEAFLEQDLLVPVLS